MQVTHVKISDSMSCQRLSLLCLCKSKYIHIQYLNRSPKLQGIFRSYSSLLKQPCKDFICRNAAFRRKSTLAKFSSRINTTAILHVLLKNKYAIWIASGTFLLILVKLIGIIGVIIIGTPLIYFKRKYIQQAKLTFERDTRVLKKYIQAITDFNQLGQSDSTLYDCFKITAKSNVGKVMIYHESKNWTFDEMAVYVDKLVSYFRGAQYDKADIIGILMPSRPEYVALILAFSKIGMIGVPMNIHLRKNILMRSINALHCRGIVISENLVPSIQPIKPLLHENKVRIFQVDGKSTKKEIIELQSELEKADANKKIKIPYKNHSFDPLLYCFSFGPKGLPSAAVIPNSKFMFTAIITTHMLELEKEVDKIYNVLPLYNMQNLMTGVGPSITNGVPIVLKHSFSPEEYFSDCLKFKCTVAQYAGDTCKTLLNQSRGKADKTHSVKLVYGQGMHPNIATKFQDRFNIPNIEYYGANEGTVNLVNLDMHSGASGHILNCITEKSQTLHLIRMHKNTLEPVRDAHGLCVLCGYNEPGLLIGLTGLRPETQFFGYVYWLNNFQKSRSLIYNVRQKGDVAFVTGDIFVKDKLGYLYFKEKVGPNFVWKAHDICVELLEEELTNITSIGQCIIYGVKIPNTMEQAIMLAFKDPESKVNINEFHRDVKENFPYYTKPIFIRIGKEFEMTASLGTIDKEKYIQAAYDPSKVNQDKLYYFDQTKNSYEVITPEIFKDIVNDVIKI